MRKNILVLKGILLSFLVLCNLLTFGQAGKLDMSYNPDDKGFGFGQAKSVNTMAVQDDGKIILGGTRYIIRLNPDGTKDLTFNTGTGFEDTYNTESVSVKSILSLPDGKILVAGYFERYNGVNVKSILRLNSDGSVDTTFKTTGPADIGTSSVGIVTNMSLQSDGKIIVIGDFFFFDNYSRKQIVRLNTNGSVDSTFEFNYSDSYNLTSIESIGAGKTLVGSSLEIWELGSKHKLFLLNDDGSIDSSFNILNEFNGRIISTNVLSNGKIIIGGDFSNFSGNITNKVLRLNPDGSIDPTFNFSLKIMGSFYSLSIQPDGKMLIGGDEFLTSGTSTITGLIRINENGEFDNTFNLNYENLNSGQFNISRCLSDGKILLAGTFDFKNVAVKNFTRVTHDGSLDKDYVGTGAEGNVNSILKLKDGKVLISGNIKYYNGSFVNGILRTYPNGKIDSTFKFNNELSYSSVIYSSIEQEDGKIIIAGYFSFFNQENGLLYQNIARLNHDGSFDNNFIPSTYEQYDKIYSIAIQSNGKILIGGVFSSTDKKRFLARLNHDGSIDSEFISKIDNGLRVMSIEVLTDSKILVSGKFSVYNLTSVKNIILINEDGSLDNSFNANLLNYSNIIPNEINSTEVQSDGRILIGGGIDSIPLISGSMFMRLNSNGSVDQTFKIGKSASGYFHAISVDFNSKIIIGGDFKLFNGQLASGIIRLNNDGSVDDKFYSSSGIDAGTNSVPWSYQTPYLKLGINSIYMQSDGNMLIGGTFTSINGIGRNGIARIKGDSYGNNCTFKTSFINVKNIDCQTLNGGATTKAYHGKEPFTYLWLNAAISKDSVATFNQAGLYTCEVTDANSCSDTASLWIAGSKHPNDFELNSNLMSPPFRTGFKNETTIFTSNGGCVNQNGQLKLVLDSLVSFESATPSPDFISGDTLIWNFTDLYYLSTPFSPKVTLKTSVLAAIGDTVHLQSIITPIGGDADSTNNIRDYYFPVINGYDPNDISVNPQGLCPEGFIKNDQTLTYTVRFQNTGNAEAVNIEVVDSLPSYLDMSTLRVVSSSDTMYTMVIPNNVIKFMFDSIMLLDSMHNEPESHGYVVFEIKPKTGLSEGTQIKNKVGIYFDFNPAVITNTVLNTISANPSAVSCTVNSTVKVKPTKSQLYPNPSEGLFTLVSESNNNNISVFDQTGKMVLSQTATTNSTTLDLRNQSPGIYFIQVQSNKGVEVLKAVLSK